MTPLRLGIIGAGDFLRWQTPALQKSKAVVVSRVFDPDQARATAKAAALGAQPATSEEAIWSDPAIDIVGIFVPPWLRRPMIERAVQTGKAVITTKPLAPGLQDADAILATTAGRIRSGIIYSRTEDPFVERFRDLFDSGELGRLTLYKQDWIHHYPQWNRWAVIPEKNGGPFMDAMIHNMNAARYLMGRPALSGTWFSDTHSHTDLPCRDTEFLKLDFADRGSAHLFITWAADLAVYGTEGNDREHIDQFFLVTDQGWFLRKRWEDGQPQILATRGEEKRVITCPGNAETHYDAFARSIASGAPNPRNLPTLEDAREDIRILKALDRSAYAREQF